MMRFILKILRFILELLINLLSDCRTIEVSNGKFVLGTGIESRRFSGETLPKSRFV